MNKRIRELMIQCEKKYCQDHDDYFYDMEKFAESMVKKFDDILVLEHLDCVGNKDRQAAERVERLREKVKTYFGVEE